MVYRGGTAAELLAGNPRATGGRLPLKAAGGGVAAAGEVAADGAAAGVLLSAGQLVGACVAAGRVPTLSLKALGLP